MEHKSILIVEDDQSFGSMLQKWFERNGYLATLCNGMMPAQKVLLSKKPFHVILSDLRLADGDGIMLLTWLREMQLTAPVIIMTGYGEVQTAVSAIKLGAFDFLEKPINPSILTKKIESALESSNSTEKKHKPASIKTDNKKLKNNSKVIKGSSELYKQMYSHINIVAPTQMSVMVVGESGTGKEHVAQMIHNSSNRIDGPFIAVDCGGLSPELAPSELFGHKKGSFTSAIEDKRGFFLAANGGTIFLDEVGNLPYGVQMQMLRSLQEKRIRPIGTSNDIDVDVRIITATNENLEHAISTGKFREDLYHRLHEFMIKVPALRDCIEDIPLYANHFLEEANSELDRNVKYITPEAILKLKSYNWPGNLRELRNVIRRSVLFSSEDTITHDSLPILSPTKSIISTIKSNIPDSGSIDTASYQYGGSHKNVENVNIYQNKNMQGDTHDQHSADSQHVEGLGLFNKPQEEKERIIKALQYTKGNKTKAAILLNIDRKTLYNKIHLYNLDL